MVASIVTLKSFSVLSRLTLFLEQSNFLVHSFCVEISQALRSWILPDDHVQFYDANEKAEHVLPWHDMKTNLRRPFHQTIQNANNY